MKKIVIGVGLGLVAASQAQAWNGGVEDMRTMHANEKRPVVRVKSVQVSVWQGQRYQHSAAAHQCNTKGICHGGWRAVKKANHRVTSHGAVCGPHSSARSAVVPRPYAKRVVKQVNQQTRAQRQAYYAAQQKRKALQLAQKRRAAQIAQQQRQAALQRKRQQVMQQKAQALQKQRVAQQQRQAALKRQALLLQKQRILQQQRLLAAKKQLQARKRAQMQQVQVQARRVVRPHYRHQPAVRVRQGYQACGVQTVQVFRPAPRPQVRQVVRHVQVTRPVVRYVQRPVQQVIVHRPVRPIYSQQIAPVFTGSMVFGGGGGGNGYVGISTDGGSGGGSIGGGGHGGGHNGHGGMGGGHNGKGHGGGGGHNGKGHGGMNGGHNSGMGGGHHSGMGGAHNGKGHGGMGGGHGGMTGGHGGMGGHGGKGMHGSKGMQGVKGSFGELTSDNETVKASSCSGWQAGSCVSTQHVKRSKHS